MIMILRTSLWKTWKRLEMPGKCLSKRYIFRVPYQLFAEKHVYSASTSTLKVPLLNGCLEWLTQVAFITSLHREGRVDYFQCFVLLLFTFRKHNFETANSLREVILGKRISLPLHYTTIWNFWNAMGREWLILNVFFIPNTIPLSVFSKHVTISSTDFRIREWKNSFLIGTECSSIYSYENHISRNCDVLAKNRQRHRVRDEKYI